MTIYLLRHGESQGNREQLFSGSSDHPLTELGRQQAQRAGERMVGAHFGHVFTSRLVRAIETTNIFLKAARATMTSRTAHAQLNERDFGSYEGKNQWPSGPTSDVETCKRISWDIDFVPPGGESMRQTHERAVSFMETIRRYASGGDILVVSHGNVLRSMTLHALGWPVDMLPEMPSRNCLITRLPWVP